MNESILSIKLVREVEKHPELFNYQIPAYSRRDITEKAWSEVGKAVNLSVAKCKERWKNLRAVFVRHMKPAPSGSGTKKKPYYLTKAMQFIIPYIRTSSLTTGNVPDLPEENENQEFKENGGLHDSQPLSPPQPSTSTIPTTSVTFQPHFTQYGNSTERQSQPTTQPKNKRAYKNYAFDKTFVEYLEAKRAKIDRAPDRNTKQNPKTEALKMFLLSMIPDLELMNDDQIRQFKLTCLQTIDNILSQNSYDIYSPAASVNSLVSQITTQSSYSLETPHTSRSVSDSASVTHMPQYESLEPCTSENSQITAADRYHNVVKEAIIEI